MLHLHFFAPFYKLLNAVYRLEDVVYRKFNVVYRKIYLGMYDLDNFG
jgi:hypothetical protein